MSTDTPELRGNSTPQDYEQTLLPTGLLLVSSTGQHARDNDPRISNVIDAASRLQFRAAVDIPLGDGIAADCLMLRNDRPNTESRIYGVRPQGGDRFALVKEFLSPARGANVQFTWMNRMHADLAAADWEKSPFVIDAIAPHAALLRSHAGGEEDGDGDLLVMPNHPGTPLEKVIADLEQYKPEEASRLLAMLRPEGALHTALVQTLGTERVELMDWSSRGNNILYSVSPDGKEVFTLLDQPDTHAGSRYNAAISWLRANNETIYTPPRR